MFWIIFGGIVLLLTSLAFIWLSYHAGRDIGWLAGFQEGEKIGLANGHESGYLEAKDNLNDIYEPRPFGS